MFQKQLHHLNLVTTQDEETNSHQEKSPLKPPPYEEFVAIPLSLSFHHQENATNRSRVGCFYDVQHNFDDLTKCFGAYWHNLSDSCIGKIIWPYGFGVGRKIDWVRPKIDGDNIISAFKGNSNIF